MGTRSYAGLAAAFGLLVMASAASAAVTLSQFPPNPGVLPGGGFKFTAGTTFGNPTGPRAWVNGVYGGVPGAIAKDAMLLRGPAGPLAVQTATRVGLTEAAGAAARCLVGMNPICLGAAAVVGAFAYSRLNVDPDLATGLMLDQGNPPIPQVEWRYSGGTFSNGSNLATGYIFSSQSAVCQNLWATTPATCGSNCTRHSLVMTPSSPAPGANAGCKVYYKLYSDVYLWVERGMLSRQESVPDTCPASIDPLNPAYSIPAGRAPGPDGRCETARYAGEWRSVTPDEAVTRVLLYPPVGGMPTTQQFAEPALSAGESIQGQSEPISGPASQTGAATTTTTTTQTETITKVTTPSYTYVYGGDTVNWAVTNTTVTTTVNNVTNETNTETSVEQRPAVVPEPDPVDPCEVDPQRLGCIKVGDAPEPDDLPAEDVPIGPVTATVFASSAGCPAPVSFELYGARQISYQGFCDVATTLRPVFLALAAVTAGFVFMGGFRL